MFKEKIKPSLVLTLICLITCALLVFAHDATYVDNTGVITDKMKECLTGIYGNSEGFEIMKNDDGSVYAPENITSVITGADGSTAFEIITKGYATDGLHVIVGLDGDGAVKGVSFIACGETPGLGTKVQYSSFLGQFNGLTVGKLPADTAETSVSKKKVWGSNDEIDKLKAAADAVPTSDTFKLDAVTGATFSSRGMNNAVAIALRTYENMKGDVRE